MLGRYFLGHGDVRHVCKVFNRFKRTGVEDVVKCLQLRQSARDAHFDDPAALEQADSAQWRVECLKAADDVAALFDGLTFVDVERPGRENRDVSTMRAVRGNFLAQAFDECGKRVRDISDDRVGIDQVHSTDSRVRAPEYVQALGSIGRQQERPIFTMHVSASIFNSKRQFRNEKYGDLRGELCSTMG